MLIFISIPENVDFGESKSYCLPIHRRSFFERRITQKGLLGEKKIFFLTKIPKQDPRQQMRKLQLFPRVRVGSFSQKKMPMEFFYVFSVNISGSAVVLSSLFCILMAPDWSSLDSQSKFDP